MAFADRYNRVKAEIAEVASRCGRDPEEVRLVAVSKTVGVDEVGEAIAAGARDFGENRIDSLAPKASAYPDATWHFIGNIQSRRIAEIAACADVVHSLYQEHHIARFEDACASLGKSIDVLIEVNVSGEESKSGCVPDEAFGLVLQLCDCPHLRPVGLMTMAPQGDEEAARDCFDKLAKLAGTIRKALPWEAASHFTELSMGMSEDWPMAVAAGATMVRIGRALFSEEFDNSI